VPDPQELDPDTPAAAGVIDEWVAWNIRLRREGLGWSQADLAKEMAALGWKYYPQTVHRVEQGQRKVTIGEAEALARLFGVTVDALTWPDMATHTAAWLGVFTGRADAAFEQIAAQAQELLFDREHLERALAEIDKRGKSATEGAAEAIDEARSVLESAGPEQAVAEGRAQYEAWRESAPDGTWDVAQGGRLADRLPRAPWLEGDSDVESA
jgi:transcriptional regulator with XRE-family HTH domain